MMGPRTDTNEIQAVIYCRVASAKVGEIKAKMVEQEVTCREFAENRGYKVVRVFTDHASVNDANLPGMAAMFVYLRESMLVPRVVIVADISTLARRLDLHLQVRNDIASTGAVLESPSIRFSDDSNSKLMEHMLVSVDEYNQNKQQTRGTNG